MNLVTIYRSGYSRGHSRLAHLIACALLVLIPIGMTPSAVAQFTEVPAGYSDHILWVRCHEHHEAHEPTDLIPAGLQSYVQQVRPLFSLPAETLKEFKERGDRLSGKSLPALYLWYEIRLDESADIVAFTDVLLSEHGIDIAEPAPLPSPHPDHEPTPDFTDLQEYLTPATDGINATYSWTFPGGNGAGIKIYDIEYNWHLTHEDLSKTHGISLVLAAGDSNDPPDFALEGNHGTAVLGELIADNDDKGVTGISWGADIGLVPQRTADLGNNVADAVTRAMDDGDPGDVILLETQTSVCNLGGCDADTQNGCGPSEWIQAVFDAVETAVGNGFIVVAAAGNGNVNLDQAACDSRFDRDTRDSGAMIVGAGGSPQVFGSDRRRLGFSSYGSRVDLQGWGEMVMTTGYGTHYVRHDDPTNRDFWYRRDFNGTSSASPIVAGAAANLQGISNAVNSTLLTSTEIREILVATGSPQLGDDSENIGPRPDLRFAIAEIINVPPVADAGPDQLVECECFDGAEITLDGSGSFDDNDDPLTYTWSIGGETIAGPTDDAIVTVTLPLGVHSVTLEVDDGNGETDTDSVTITVEDTTPPVITLEGESLITLECGIENYEEEGAAVEDICDEFPSLVIDNSEVDTHTPGTYTVTYTANDASSNESVEERTVNVVDTTPPQITVLSEPMVLWPPNHHYHTIRLSDLEIEVDDECDLTLTPDDVRITAVSSDEEENATGGGDGNTLEDMIIGETCDFVQLRAERQGRGNGRVYTLTLEVADASGNVGSTTYQVHVPHNMRGTPAAIDDGPVFVVSAEECEPGAAAQIAAGPQTDSADTRLDPFGDGSGNEVPEAFALEQNYPNPFNPVTEIRFALPEEVNVELVVYDVIGRAVDRLLHRRMPAGHHSVTWDAGSLPTGIYVYQLKAGDFITARRMTLVK